ncbi:MAG TPA: sensor histidine kinase [Terriglobales bacterium]|nr:sensor histidine kinase [Terriglobales bacterium]
MLTRADQVRRLTPEQAAQGYPVRIRGVITDDVPAPDFFVQDSYAGIYVEGSKLHSFAHHFGDLVEVEGITGPGKFAPVIREENLRVLGKGRLPKTRVYSFEELADGQLDSQWVQVRGIVRSVAIDHTSWREVTLAMHLAVGPGQLAVRIPIAEEHNFSRWIDSEILLEGVCGSLFNAQRQLSGVLLYVPRLSLVKLEAPAKEVPFAALLTFSPGNGTRHRVRVRGTVEYQQPGQAVFLQNQGKGLRVRSQQEFPLAPGDVVDVLGFPAMGESAPVLEDSVFQLVRRGAPPSPLPLDLSVPWEKYDGMLITTEATVLHRDLQPDGVRLLLQQGQTVFEASLQGEAGSLMSVPLSSKVRITGICLVRSGGLWSIPQSFRVLLRSPHDVAVLRAPSWWNLRHALWLLGITLGVLLMVMAWVVVLGRRLREQMALIGQKLRSGAVLQERNRIARELHDTLEQELAGITMQLDLAVDCFLQAPQVARQAMETARNMSRHSMVEARRSVWDLRCQLLEHGDLVSALTQIVRTPSGRNHNAVTVSVHGNPMRLPVSIEMNLLRIGQEAVANAVRHGSATRITVELRYAPEAVSLYVSDDGSGFRSEVAGGSGHFGLQDMQERARSMGCQLQIDSQPGQGTRIRVQVPIGQQQFLDQALKINSYSRS